MSRRGGDRPRCAYVTSRYPYVSHTFIRREVEALRGLGIEVETITVRRPVAEEVISAADRREQDRTFAVRPVGAFELLRDHWRAIAAGPAKYLAALAATIRDSGGGIRATVWQFLYFLQAIRLWAHLDRLAIAHIHVHHANVAADLAMIAAGFAIRLDRPLIWTMTVHGPTDLDDPRGHKLSLKATRAAAVIAISEYGRGRIERLVTDSGNRARVEVIRCGVDPAEFDLERPERDTSRFKLLTVARLEPRKGVRQLLDAVALARRSGAPVELSVVGDGPERRELEQRAVALGLASVVSFEGAVAADLIARRYREADAFCLASRAEGVPIVLMEAMAARLPVIATAVAGIPELIRDRESGVLVAPDDPEAMAAAIQRLADDPRFGRRIADAGREAVIAGYTVSGSAARIARLFGELQSQRTAG